MSMFIQTFISNRARLGSVYSDLHETGVPQTSILRVCLFILKINRIAGVIPSSFQKSPFKRKLTTKPTLLDITLLA